MVFTKKLPEDKGEQYKTEQGKYFKEARQKGR